MGMSLIPIGYKLLSYPDLLHTSHSISMSVPSVLFRRCLEWTLQWFSVATVHWEQYCSNGTALGMEVKGSKHFFCCGQGSRGIFSGQEILTPVAGLSMVHIEVTTPCTPSTKQFLPERVTLPSGNEISIVH